MYGRGKQIKVQGVTDALASISKTIQLAGEQSPLYRDDKRYQLCIERLVEGFRREDPPAIPQLAIPIDVPNLCYTASLQSNDPEQEATGALTLIAFYYLLRVGEYTQPRYVYRNGRKDRATRTVQFCVKNVGFFKDGKLVPRDSPLSVLVTCDSATLKITNQKNGRMGDTIHHEAVTHLEACPVKALARRVHHILSNGGTEDALLCSYHKNHEWHTVTSRDIINAVRTAAKILKLDQNAIDPDLIGAHSLRAGGAMALKLHGYDDTTIMKFGRWTSLTFLQYIHNQIAHLSKDVSRAMSTRLQFTNIAAI